MDSHCRFTLRCHMKTEPLILALDDEPGILRLLKLELDAQGFHVVTASSGAEALRLAEEQRPDLLLLDIMIPELSGLEIMRSLRERMNTPVILLTGKDQEIDKVRGLEVLCAPWLSVATAVRV